MNPNVIDDSALLVKRYGDVRAAVSHETALHRAADKHGEKLHAAMRFAFGKARAALRKSLAQKSVANYNAALSILKDTLEEVVPSRLAEIVVAGGRASAGMLKTAEFDESKHPRDERGRWTSGDIVHHGSTADFEFFDLSKIGSTTDEGWLGRGVYFSTDKRVSHFYPLAYETEVRLDNPLKLEMKSFSDDKRTLIREALDLPKDASVDQVTTELKKRGHDGVILDMSPTGYKAVEVMAMDVASTKIVKKYETGNTKMWDEKAFGRPEKYRRSLSAVSDLVFRTAKAPNKRVGPFTIAFDTNRPESVDWADRHAAELIDNITETTRERINNAVAEYLETGDWNTFYDEVLESVGEERVDLIARHEPMLAVHEGQREAWNQAVEEGLLTGDEKVTWIIVGDEKTCPICLGLDGKLRGLDGEYTGDDGEKYIGPPAHVACRCTEGLA